MAGGEGCWTVGSQTRGPAGSGRRGGESRGQLSASLPPVPDGPTQLRALNLSAGAAVLHWKPPQAPVDTYAVQVAAPGGEQGSGFWRGLFGEEGPRQARLWQGSR